MKYENTDAYRYLSYIYDLMSDDLTFDFWGNYIASFFEKNKPSVLEYACGTGNITAELAKYSSSVTAVDISAEMLAQAQEKLKRSVYNIKFIETDMTRFLLNKPVDCIVCANDGVNYITDIDNLNLFFANVYANLKRGGVFLFDISSEYKNKNILGNEFYYTDDEDATLFWQNKYDNKKSTVKMELTIFLKNDGVYHRYDELHYQRAWKTDEIKDCLINKGFNEVCKYSFGSRDKPKSNDERIQFAVRK